MTKKTPRWAWLPFLLAGIVLFVCSKNSPLYPGNDWCDVNCFMTVGRAMKEGAVLYRDVYEQKGPLLYFLYCVLSLFSEGYFPVYVAEVASYGTFLYFSARTLMLYSGNTAAVIAGTVFLGTVPLVSTAFFQGGSVEEMLLLCLAGPLYFILRAVRDGTAVPAHHVMLCGMMCGACFWTKYTICGFFLGACLFIVWYDLHRDRSGSELSRSVLWFAAGFAVVSLPVAIYFSMAGCMGDLWRVYFHDNIFVYLTKTTNEMAVGSYVERFVSRVRLNVRTAFGANPVAMAVSSLGLLYSVERNDANKFEYGFVGLSFLGLCISTFVFGAPYCYYSFIFTAFMAFGMCQFMDFVKLRAPMLVAFAISTLPVSVGLWTASCLLLSVLCCKNLYYLKYWKEPSPQAIFADIVSSEMGGRRPLVLQYANLDMGFLRACGSELPRPYFCGLNVGLPELQSFQDGMVSDRKADYVVTYGCDLDWYEEQRPGLDASGYELVRTVQGPYWDQGVIEIDFHLYRRAQAAPD